LVDADPLAGGLDLLLGAEHIRGARWTELADVRGLVDPGALAESLPAVNGLRLLSGDRGGTEPPVEAMAALLAALRGLGSPVVVDLPHRPGAAAERAAGMCTGVVVVVLGEVRAAAAAARVAASAARCCDDVRVVVRVGPRSRLRPAEVSAAVGLPLLGVLQSDPAVAAAADRGDLARGAAGGLAGVAGDVIGWLDALVAAS
jgi:secretion/DNA translocation related CpaE-like protein